jgi:hypothetical protein
MLVHCKEAGSKPAVSVCCGSQPTWNSLSMASLGSSLMHGLLVMFLALQHKAHTANHANVHNFKLSLVQM